MEGLNVVRKKTSFGELLSENDNIRPSRTLLEYLREVVTSEGHEVLSPICRIPQEVLTEIFMYCIPEDFRFTPTAAPLLLCDICNLWRNIVISTPSFWNRLAFWSHPRSLPHYRSDGSALPASCYPEDLAKIWLERSGGRSLELFFERFMAVEHLELFMPTLFLQLSRCRHLELNVKHYNASALIDFVTLSPGLLVQLESLVLEGLKDTATVTVFQASPRLQKVTANNLKFATTLSDGDDSPRFNPSAVPWPQLTYLVLTKFIKVGLFTAMLSECSNLEFLRASLDGSDTTDNITRTITLFGLKEMYLSIQNATSIPPVLNHFIFPALETLHFRRRCIKPHPNKEFFWRESRHFRTQLSKLRQLTLVGETGAIDEVLNLLLSVSGLNKLLLDIEIDYEGFLPHLFPMSTSIPSPIPSLNFLELHLYGKQLPFSNPNQLLQPCLFRVRQMLESTSICSLHAIYHRGDFRKRASEELERQFSSSGINLSINVLDLGFNTWTRRQDDSRMMSYGHHTDDDGNGCGVLRDGHTMKEGRARLCFTHSLS